MTEQHRVNEQIRVSPVVVLDQNNERLGILATLEALHRARQAGLDLVEVEPDQRPPICRIMDYGNFAYEKKSASRRHLR
jgi:translation initiation factor IF-3